MKTPVKNLLRLLTLIPAAGLVFNPRATAQSFTNLYSFTGGADGANPWAALVLTNNTLYGTTYSGGGGALAGTIFAINTDGSGFTNVHVFTSADDGANPCGALILSGNGLYGTARSGGTLGNGTVFSLNTDGSNFKTIYSFSGSTDGATPWGGLVLSGTTLYGTVKTAGGSSSRGTVFKVDTDGLGFTTMHTFTGGNDGGYPIASLILSGSTLYGTAQQGGSAGNGTVFAISTNGTGF